MPNVEPPDTPVKIPSLAASSRPAHADVAGYGDQFVTVALVDRLLQDQRDEVRGPPLNRVRLKRRMARGRRTVRAPFLRFPVVALAFSQAEEPVRA